jgi:hypothetical protein
VDPRLGRVHVTRYTCKVCGYVRREYPVGVGPGRLSLAMVAVCRFLREFGLSMRQIHDVLRDLGCPTSIGTLHRLLGPRSDDGVGRLRLTAQPGRPAHLVGRDGDLTFEWDGDESTTRHLVVTVVRDTSASGLRWRLARALRGASIPTSS